MDLNNFDTNKYALCLRTCNADGTSYGGFKWPSEIGSIVDSLQAGRLIKAVSCGKRYPRLEIKHGMPSRFNYGQLTPLTNKEKHD